MKTLRYIVETLKQNGRLSYGESNTPIANTPETLAGDLNRIGITSHARNITIIASFIATWPTPATHG